MASSQVQIAFIGDENTTTTKLYLTVGPFSLKSGPLSTIKVISNLQQQNKTI